MRRQPSSKAWALREAAASPADAVSGRARPLNRPINAAVIPASEQGAATVAQARGVSRPPQTMRGTLVFEFKKGEESRPLIDASPSRLALKPSAAVPRRPLVRQTGAVPALGALRGLSSARADGDKGAGAGRRAVVKAAC